jgi:Protein of unknown function (DUF2505)
MVPGIGYPPFRSSFLVCIVPAAVLSPYRFRGARSCSRPSLLIVHFEITHEFDIPLDALELAVVSPALVDKLGAKVHELGVGIETIRERTRSWNDGVLERVWHYQADIRIPPFARAYVTREMCAWDEESVYQMSRHRGEWTITPHVKPEWRSYFASEGTYEIVPLGGGRSRRTIRGELELRVRLVRQMAERLIVGEVKKAFAAEAATLRDMATLG